MNSMGIFIFVMFFSLNGISKNTCNDFYIKDRYGYLGIASSLKRSKAFYADQAHFIRNTKSFKKLAGLYQFVINYSDPTLTNRLKHSEDVSETARMLSQELGLSDASQELAAVIGLAHDIGHPIFSHWGETALRKRLRPHGLEWNHDTAGLLAVTEWAQSPHKLSIETIEGLSKRFWKYDEKSVISLYNHAISEVPASIRSRNDFEQFELAKWNHIEGQIAAQSDRIAFNATDIQDGLRVGRITPDVLNTNFPSAYKVYLTVLNEVAQEYVRQSSGHRSLKEISEIIEGNVTLKDFVYRKFADKFRRFQMDDLLSSTRTRLASITNYTALDVRSHSNFLVDFSPSLQNEFKMFAKYSRDVIFARSTAPLERIVDKVVDLFLSRVVQMHSSYDRRFNLARNEAEKILIIGEYVTRELSDQNALDLVLKHSPETYIKYFPGYEKVISPSVVKTKDEVWRMLDIILDDRAHSVEEIKPTQQQIEKYAKEMIADGKTSDPLDPNKSDIVSTATSFSNKLISPLIRGQYSMERVHLHEKIVAQALSDKDVRGIKGKPYFLCVSGGMSVGMTYMQRLLVNEGVVQQGNTVIITPMSFMPLPEFRVRSHYQHPEKSPLLVDEYYHISKKIIEAAIERGLNVLYVDQADHARPILEMARIARTNGYDTGMLGLTMTPEAYFAASELWLTNFNRLTDHYRGFGDLKEFSENWLQYRREFGFATLFETYFHVEDIHKSEDDVRRKEYTVKPIALSYKDHNGVAIDNVFFPRRYIDFINRGLFINPESKTPQESRRNFPKNIPTEQLVDNLPSRQVVAFQTNSTNELVKKLADFISGDFEARFVNLVQETTRNRRQQSKDR